MYAAGITLIYIIIIIIEIIPMVKDKKRNMIFTYITLMAVSLILSVLLSLKVELPSPASAIERVVIPIIKK